MPKLMEANKQALLENILESSTINFNHSNNSKIRKLLLAFILALFILLGLVNTGLVNAAANNISKTFQEIFHTNYVYKNIDNKPVVSDITIENYQSNNYTTITNIPPQGMKFVQDLSHDSDILSNSIDFVKDKNNKPSFMKGVIKIYQIRKDININVAPNDVIISITNDNNQDLVERSYIYSKQGLAGGAEVGIGTGNDQILKYVQNNQPNYQINGTKTYKLTTAITENATIQIDVEISISDNGQIISLFENQKDLSIMKEFLQRVTDGRDLVITYKKLYPGI